MEMCLLLIILKKLNIADLMVSLATSSLTFWNESVHLMILLAMVYFDMGKLTTFDSHTLGQATNVVRWTNKTINCVFHQF